MRKRIFYIIAVVIVFSGCYTPKRLTPKMVDDIASTNSIQEDTFCNDTIMAYGEGRSFQSAHAAYAFAYQRVKMQILRKMELNGQITFPTSSLHIVDLYYIQDEDNAYHAYVWAYAYESEILKLNPNAHCDSVQNQGTLIIMHEEKYF